MPGPTTLRPSAEHFRRAGWLPVSQQPYDQYIDGMRRKIIPLATAGGEPDLLVSVKAFKDFIESDATVYLEFVRMFEGISTQEIPSNPDQLCIFLNEIFRQAPNFGSLGPPMYMAMAKIMDTQGGFSAFTKEKLNWHFKQMLNSWETFLLSKDSCEVLHQEDGGWLSPDAQKAMMAEFEEGRTFAQVFICSPDEPYYGYTSYEDFFVRRFREPHIDRPIDKLDNLQLISAACESVLYAIQTDVQREDPLWIKDEAYSLVHLLAGDESVDSFVGGTVIQSFLNTTGYHRWHAPVTGKIVKIVDIPGTYFAQSPDHIGKVPGDGEPPVYLQSLRFFSNCATRQLIFIQAKNASIGLMCFVAIGMTEISTCQATVYEGQEVNRGDELGMFHFGGSSSAMVFNKGANIQVDGESTEPGTPLRINSTIAVAAPPPQ
ncbi:hypothetical protein VNI00_004842 [Paramarasmius palmivorus]|uniref:L-tryptophan decarboxylase PsiD-like domain-containing protein n=1 Tax=Paramarasmius palmivorus TaxID=297713 RepID=A0AAW0DHZ8_9AGAR